MSRLVEFRAQVAALEDECLYKAPMLPTEVETRAKKTKESFPELENEHGALEHYVGAAWHEYANTYRKGFIAYLEDEAKQRKIPIINLTEKDVDEIYQSFPDKQTLEATEDLARAAYAKATRRYWESIRQDSNDARVLRIDLEDRVAQSRLTGEEREDVHRRNLKALESIVDSMTPSGRQSELKLLCILRKCILDRKVGHLITVEHGLPREDLAEEKIDLRLILGVKYANIQLKTELTSDEYRREHYEGVRAKASAAIEDQQTRLAVEDTDTLNTAYRSWVKGGETKAEKAAGKRALNDVLEMLGQAMSKKSGGLFSLLKEREKKEVPLSGKKITRDFIARNSGIPVLVALGLVSEGSPINVEAIRKAKELLSDNLPTVSKIFGSQEGFMERDPEKVAELRSELGL